MNNLFDGLSFSLSSLEDFSRQDFVSTLIRCFINAPPGLRPTTFGSGQPTKQSVSSANSFDKMLALLTPKKPLVARGHVKLPDGLLLLELSRGGHYLIHWKHDVVPSFAGISGVIPWYSLDTPVRIEQILDFIKELCAL